MRGGSGTDTADYSARTTDVIVSLDGDADDGSIITERDNVATDVENVIGGSAQDNLVGTDAANRLEGGPGFDVLNGAGGDDVLLGGDGSDHIEGRAGKDTIDGEGSGDQIDGGDGADDMRGGAGVDQVAYLRTTAVAVSLDDAANDGSFSPFGGPIGNPAEGDNVHSDVENLSTGSGNDLIVGSATANRISSNGGNDIVDGRAGPDHLDTGEGTDRVTYAGRTTGVSVTLGDGLPDEGDATAGPAGARDTLIGVENVTGGSGPRHARRQRHRQRPDRWPRR